MKGKHYYSLDILRAVSAIFIVLYHWTFRYNENSYIVASEAGVNWPIGIWWGFGAVTTFFMLSGFLTSRYFSLSKSEGKPSKYLVGRFFRLYPTFWAAVIITTCGMCLMMDEAVVSIRDFLLNLTMLPSVLGAKSIDGAYWTMQLEIFFSVIVALALLMRKPGIRISILYVWILATLGYNLIGNDPAGITWKLFRLFSMPVFSGSFVGGIALFQIVMKRDRNTLSIFLPLYLLATLNSWLGFENYINFIFFMATSLWMMLTHQMEALINPNNRIIKIFSWIAGISYSMYLIHQMIGIAIIRTLVSLDIESEWSILIPFAIVLGLSYLLHLLVELPSANLGRKLSKRIS